MLKPTAAIGIESRTPMLDWACTATGITLLALSSFEVYATILRARKRPGPLSTRLNRGLWWLASRVSFRMKRKRRHAVLSAVGPLLLPLLGAVLFWC